MQRTQDRHHRLSSKVRLVVSAGALVVAAACGAGSSGDLPLTAFEETSSPAASGSMAPNLFADGDGRVYMSWLETADAEPALRFAVWDENGWSPARPIREGADFWVNWADFPSLVVLPDGRLAAHWLQRSGPGTFDYDVHVTLSEDGGESWSESVVPHRDGTLSEHGFVSLFPWEDGSLAAVWLDGRHYVEAGETGEAPEMSLRHTRITEDGALAEEVMLDDRVCDCCQTSAVVTTEGPVVFYRDRSPEEVRDISVIRYVDGRWTAPRPVHEDRWVIPACPVNGPFADGDGRAVAVAWFTAADDTPVVQVAFSDDAGDTFGPPVRVDDGDPTGRVALALLGDGEALVSWLERTNDGAEIRVRRLTSEGDTSPSRTVTATATARASGFPRMVRNGHELVFAWTEPGEPSRVRTARATVGGAR